jgi:hypothetical protein
MHYHLEFYHFDTTNQWNPSFQQIFNNSNSSPFNLTLTLPNQIDKVKRIYLKSIEMPIGFTNIRSDNNSNTLTITINTTLICTITLSSMQYTISTLITAINNAISSSSVFTGVNSSYLPVFSVSGQIVSVSVPGQLIANISLNNTILTNVVLGFPYNYQLPLSNNITAPSNYNIAYDNYLIMNFPNVNARSTAANNQQISFKIPYNGTANAIFFNVENQSFSQYLELTDHNPVIGNLKVVINDKFGNPINNNGLDWSFTLAFQRDQSIQVYHTPMIINDEKKDNKHYFDTHHY